MAQDVVTGLLVDDKVRGRPVGVGIDGTGALLVADDTGNTVWRVAAADGRVSEAPIETDRVATAGGTSAAGPETGPETGSPAPEAPADAPTEGAEPPAQPAPPVAD